MQGKPESSNGIKPSGSFAGTAVPGGVGKVYNARYRESVSQPCQPAKPVRLGSSELSTLSGRGVPRLKVEGSGTTMRDDVQEFLCKMLEDGFQLDKNKVQEVIGHCGYDMQLGMDHLFHLSASKLKKSDDVVGISEKLSSGKHLGLEYLSSQELQYQDSGPSGEATAITAESQKKRKNNKKLEKEILQSLFTVPERSEEAPKRLLPRRYSDGYNLVKKPFSDTFSEACKHVTVTEVPQESEEEDNEDSYDMLREAVKEYWVTMKEYYKAAVNAFTKGEHVLADKLLNEGRSFYERARKADDKSAEMLFNTREYHTIALDLGFHDTKVALRLLETHLTNLSGIPSMNLKIILSAGEETKKEARKRLKVLKLLEEASIGWTEDDNGQVLWISMEKLNPKTLFFKKTLKS